MAYIGRQNLGGAYRQLDDISSGFDGSDTTHTMQVNSQNVTVGDVNQIILSLGGVIQKPGTDFTVSGSTLTFTTAPAANTNFFAILLGSDNGGTVTPTDGSVTGDKLASTVTTCSNISLDGGTFIFNESGADKDFRIESDDNANMFFVDAGNNKIGINTTGSTPSQVTIEDVTGNGGGTLGLTTDTSGTSDNLGRLHFGNATDGSLAAVFGIADGASDAGALTFRTEATGAALEEAMRIHSDGDVSIGTTNGRSRLEVFNSATGTFDTSGAIGATASDDNIVLGLMNESNSATFCGLAFETRTTGAGRFMLMNKWNATYESHLDFVFRDGASSSDEYLKISPSGEGEFYFGSSIAGESENPVSGNGSGSEGVGLFAASYTAFAVDSNPVAYFNRMTNDGIVIRVRVAGSDTGGIQSQSGVVSIVGFTGTHWSRLEDNSTPTILKGTIMESIDKMMDWYQVVYTNKNGNEHRHNISLPDGAKVGDDYQIADPDFKETKYEEIDIFYTAEDGNTIPEGKKIGDRRPGMDGKNIGDVKDAKPVYTGKIILEEEIKHTYSKISDTADSKKIYGVFQAWDEDTEGDDDDVNDFTVAQTGTFVIRVNKDVTVEAGDLLVSNGDGTAKKQDDDIIRSKTVAKVNSNVKVETYSDGSYTVPCTLLC